MNSFLDVPSEIIREIATFLPVRDVVSLSESCRILHEVTGLDSVWKHLCQKDYGVITAMTDVPFSYKDIYTKLLHKYGKLIGLWQSDVKYYGGLLQVKFEESGIVVKELSPSRGELTDPLQSQTLFTISLNDAGQVMVQCISGYRGPHEAEIEILDLDRFSFKCSDEEHHTHPAGEDKELCRFWCLGSMKWRGCLEFMEWWKPKTSVEPVPFDSDEEDAAALELLKMKFIQLKEYFKCVHQFQRVKLQEQNPIQTGIFKAKYSSHGMELCHLTYEENDSMAIATKITGDPNVPAREITFRVDLCYPMVLTRDDQVSIASLSSIEPEQVSLDKTSSQPERTQPFYVPSDCLEFPRGLGLPEICNDRYLGWAHVAYHGFVNPSFIKGHWILFNEDMFGFIFLDLACIQYYHRVKID